MTLSLGRLVPLAQTLARPGGLRAALRWRPFSITAFRMLRTLKRLGLQPQTIIDAGANAGQFSRAAAETFPEARIHAFEALPDLAERLERRLADCPRITVHRTAVGSTAGTLSFYRHPYTLASSALPSPGARGVEEIQVPVARLDDVLSDGALPRPLLLKMDLQGFELEALKGAERLLRRTDHVLLEAAFEAGYEGAPSFGEITNHLAARGFRFSRPVSFLSDDAGVVQEMDALFVREGA